MCQFPYYPATYIMRQVDSGTHRSIDIWHFKSTKSNRTYIVEIEHFGKHLIAVKFFPKDFRNSKFRYSLMTNDYEPRTIVYSCLYVVKHYIDTDPLLSFGFVAASDIDEKTATASEPQVQRIPQNNEPVFRHANIPAYPGCQPPGLSVGKQKEPCRQRCCHRAVRRPAQQALHRRVQLVLGLTLMRVCRPPRPKPGHTQDANCMKAPMQFSDFYSLSVCYSPSISTSSYILKRHFLFERNRLLRPRHLQYRVLYYKRISTLSQRGLHNGVVSLHRHKDAMENKPTQNQVILMPMLYFGM